MRFTNVVYTDPKLAELIITHFRPQFKETDTFLDPSKGSGAFYDLLPPNKDWCEIEQGRDFFEYDKKVDWILTNPPWSPTEFDHSLKEIVVCKYQDAGFAQRGFVLGVFHWQKNYDGGTRWTYWND